MIVNFIPATLHYNRQPAWCEHVCAHACVSVCMHVCTSVTPLTRRWLPPTQDYLILNTHWELLGLQIKKLMLKGVSDWFIDFPASFQGELDTAGQELCQEQAGNNRQVFWGPLQRTQEPPAVGSLVFPFLLELELTLMQIVMLNCIFNTWALNYHHHHHLHNLHHYHCIVVRS